MRTGLLAFAMSLGLTACASSASSPPQSPPPPRLPTAVSVIPAIGLEPQTLDAGECALFLWAQTDINKLIFFSKGQTNRAVLKLSQATYNLEAQRVGGDVFGQFLSHTIYSDGTGGQVELTFDPGEQLIDGQRIRNGLITRTAQDGWQIKLPVLGVRACMPE